MQTLFSFFVIRLRQSQKLSSLISTKFGMIFQKKKKKFNQVILYIDSLNENDLKALGVFDRTIAVIQAFKFYFKKYLVYSAQERCPSIERESKAFEEQFYSLIELGLLAPWMSKFRFFSDASNEENILKKQGDLQNVNEEIEGFQEKLL